MESNNKCQKCGASEFCCKGKCINCKKIYAAAYREKNREKARLNTAKWRKENPEKAKATAKAYREASIKKTKARSALYYAKNKDALYAKLVAWREKNKDKMSGYWTKHYKENAKSINEYKAKKYALNPTAQKERIAAWAEKNKEARRIHAQNRQARKIENGGILSVGLAKKLYKLQKGLCPCCKQPLGDDYHLDHIQPLSLGGKNEDSNIQLLRQRCNNQKHAKHPIDFMQSRGFLL